MLAAHAPMTGVGTRNTPPGPISVRRSRLGWALLGLTALALLGLGTWTMSSQQAGMAAGTPKAVPAARTATPASAAPATLLPADAPAPAAPVQAEMPSTKVELAAEQGLTDPAAARRAGLPKVSDAPAPNAMLEPVQVRVPAVVDRSKRARPQPPVKARAVKLIPGDRTKGLSVDEF
jgi:hypothetical protein